MFLKRAILVNWGNIPKLEFDFGPVNLFSGGNGSGKTTAADAIQALVTAAHENLFAFNPGQDETTQRGRGGKQVRTLASYLLGCDDGSYARPYATDGYVAGVFHPTTGESGEVFTAIMAMRGHLEKASQPAQARLDDMFFILIPGEELRLDHLVGEFKDGKHLHPIDKIVALLKKRFSGSAIEVYDKKGAYLRRLYGALRGRKDAVSDREAKHAARTFSGFMAYKPVKSIHDFVANEILEPKDLGEAIRNVSDLMKTIHEMEENAGNIIASIETLESARQLASDYTTHWIDRQALRYSQASTHAWLCQKRYLEAKNKQKSTVDQIAESVAFSELAGVRKDELHERIVKLEAQRQGIQALRDKDALQKTVEQGHKRLVDFAQPMLTQIQMLHSNIQQAQNLLDFLKRDSIAVDLPLLGQSDFLKQTKTIASNEDAAALDVHQLLNQDWIDIQPVEDTLTNVIRWQGEQNAWAAALYQTDNTQAQNVRDQLRQLSNTRQAECRRLANDLAQIKKEINILSCQQVSYPPQVEQAVLAIKEYCPEADPRVLCDYVEVLEERWQMAIEGYIGGARFAILVEPEYEADAIRVVKAMRGTRRNNAKVIQGGKAQKDANRLKPVEDSVINVMRFSHSTAEAYIQASYGSVRRVESAEALRHVGRGITCEGLASGNYSMWRCDMDDAQLVFGQGARERALRAKQEEYNSLSIRANNSEESYQQLLRLCEMVEAVKPLELARALEDMIAVQRDIQNAEAELEDLDLGETKALDDQLQAYQKEYQEKEAESKALEQALGSLKEKKNVADKQVQKISAEQDELQASKDTAEEQLQDVARVYPRFDANNELEKRDALIEEFKGDLSIDDDLQAVSLTLNQKERGLYENVLKHNQASAPEDALVYDTGYTDTHGLEFFKHIVNIGDMIEKLHNRLKNNLLVEKYRQLTRLKESFNTAFITNLCHSIYQAINEGESIIEDLNKELQDHQFGADRERYYFGMTWVSEYEEYWQFFKALINLPSLGDGTTLFDADLKPKLAKVRDRLMSMLLDKDVQTAHRELSRISDYRNYRRYEIYKEPANKAPIALSQYGTGSGGQLETPAYIIRSAAVTSAFRFNEGRAHMRMVMVDEAFSKMDEGRSREVINYLTDRLGLQLLFIMPTSKSGPFLDMITNQFVFAKCPTSEPVGELKTRVIVDRKTCNQEQIKNLWAKHRKVIRQQATLDFMAGIEG